MIGSAAIVSLLAHGALWLLLFYGWLSEDLTPRVAAILAVVWLACFFWLPHVPYGAALFAPLVAIADIALVLTIFKGDVRLD